MSPGSTAPGGPPFPHRLDTTSERLSATSRTAQSGLSGTADPLDTASATPPSPSNPPSPSDTADVPLLRLGTTATAAASASIRTRAAMQTPSTSNAGSTRGEGLAASGFVPRENRHANALRQFRSQASLRGGTTPSSTTTTASGGSSSRIMGGSGSVASRSTVMRNGGGGGKSGYGYAGSEAGTAQSVTDGGGDAHSEADSLLGGIEPDPNSRGTRRSGRTARGRRGEAAIPVGLGGRGESDGDFDAGWTTGLEAEEEEIGLLASGRLDRVRRETVDRIRPRADPPVSCRIDQPRPAAPVLPASRHDRLPRSNGSLPFRLRPRLNRERSS